MLLGAVNANADVISDWNSITMALVGQPEPVCASTFCGDHAAGRFEAVNAIKGDYKPYLGTVKASGRASAEAAAVAAAYRVLATFSRQPGNLDAARATSLGSIADGAAKDAGIAVGEAAANAMATGAADGSSPPEYYVPPAFEPGSWQVTPSCPAAGGALLQWRNVTPFGIGRRTSSVRSHRRRSRAASIQSRSRGEDGRQHEQHGTAARRRDVARLYAAIAAPAVWNIVAEQVLDAERSSLSERARTLALVNMAISDGGVAVFDTKYHYTLWRPETAIHFADLDDNPRTEADPRLRVVTTPCFPSYPSAHGTLSSAAREVLERLYGRAPIDSYLESGTRQYADLRNAARDHRRYRRRCGVRRHSFPVRSGGGRR